MHANTIRAAAEQLQRDLHLSSQALKRLQHELTSHLAAVALGTPDNGRANELRRDITTHERILSETPDVISLLYVQEAGLIEQQQDQECQLVKSANDKQFKDLLNHIITSGSATSYEIQDLRRYASNSGSSTRRYMIDRLEDALADHDRRTKNARASNQPPPVFNFNIEKGE